jgi:hypothetical protein
MPATVKTIHRRSSARPPLAHFPKGILRGNSPDTDEVVSETSEQRLAIGGPCDRYTLWLPRASTDIDEFWLEFVDNRPGEMKALLRNVENLER